MSSSEVALDDEGRAGQAQSSYRFVLSSRAQQPAAEPHGSRVRLADARDGRGARERRASEGGGLRKCRRRFLSQSLRLPRQHRGSDQHPARSDRPRGMAGRPGAPDARPFVSIALIRGRATGNGSELALACDMSFASRERAVLSQWEVGVGLVAGGGPMARLPRVIGRGRALEVAPEFRGHPGRRCRAARLREPGATGCRAG